METPKTRWTIAVLFCLTVGVPALLHQLFGEGAPPLPAGVSLPQIEAYEDALEERSPLSEPLRPWTQRLLLQGGAPGGGQAYLGRSRQGGVWLFYEPDVKHTSGSGFSVEEPLSAILDFQRQLEARGIRLIVMPTAPKSAVEWVHFARRRIKPGTVLRNPSYEMFIKRLRAEGVWTLEAIPSAYLRTDTHWTPSAMRETAEKAARFIEARVELKPRTESYARQTRSVEGRGDLAEMLDMELPAERVEIEPIETADGSAWQARRGAEILLLGDSFSNIYSLEEMSWGSSAGFAEQLSYALGRPIDRIALNEGGSHTTRRELARDAGRLAAARVVLWQFAARELSWGDWRLYQLGAFERSPTPSEPSEPSGAAPVSGVVLELTRPPAPGSTPYGDCVVALRLGELSGAGAELPAEAVAFVWGMRAHEWTRAASLKVGDRVKLRLRPWSEAEAEYGRYSRKELESEESWLLDAYWGEWAE